MATKAFINHRFQLARRCLLLWRQAFQVETVVPNLRGVVEQPRVALRFGSSYDFNQRRA